MHTQHQHNQEKEKTIETMKNEDLEKIGTGEVRMRSKYIFALKMIAIIALALFVIGISSLLLSFIFFSVMVSGRMILLGFGFRGLGMFIMTFPWVLLLIDLLLVVSLERLIKHFQFGYRTPLVYIIGGIVAFNLLSSIIIFETPFHHMLAQHVRINHTPLIGQAYRGAPMPPHDFGVFRGIVTSTGTSSFVIKSTDTDNDADNIGVGSTTNIRTIFLSPGMQVEGVISVGDYVFVAGDLRGLDIFAFGVQKLGTSTEDY